MEQQKSSDIEQPVNGNNLEDSDEVVFVSAGLQRPVVAFIELSDEESNLNNPNDEGKTPAAEDHVDRVKARVQSTLERLARNVEEDKESRRAHNELLRVQRDSLQAHGTYMLGLCPQNPDMQAAKKCVEYYAKKPALRPGNLHANRRQQAPGCPTYSSFTEALNCPIKNCLRTFDNRALLLGHMKRFDHSPCDPCVMLKGVPIVKYVCGPCQRMFYSMVDYEVHLLEKLKDDSSLSICPPHKPGASPLSSRHFACPDCFLLFTLHDQCLQHMQQQGHFRSTYPIEKQKEPCPIVFPDYAKNMLVSLCREVEFTVTCVSCGQGLRSNNHVTEHFRLRCQGGWPLALAKQPVSDVAKVFWAAGRCLLCAGLALLTEDDCANHEAATGHLVWRINNMQVALIAFCYFRSGVNSAAVNDGKTSSSIGKNYDGKTAGSHSPQPSTSSTDTGAFPHPACSSNNNDDNGSGVGNIIGGSSSKAAGGGRATEAPQWVCECGSVLATEDEAFEHLVATNSVHFRCLVCRTVFLAESIVRLHMSRTHGGAHLSDYERWCCSCRIEVPSGRNGIAGHLLNYHPGHSFYFERRGGDDDETPATEATAAPEYPATEPALGAAAGGAQGSEAAGTSGASPQKDNTVAVRPRDSDEQQKTLKPPRKKHKVADNRGPIYKCCFCKKASYLLEAIHDHLKSHMQSNLSKKGPHYLVLCPECRTQLLPGKSTCQRCGNRVSGGGSSSNNGVGSSGGGGYPFLAAYMKVQLDLEPKPMPFEFTASPSPESSPDSSNQELPDADYLSTMSHVLLIDLDNWPNFFQKLPAQLQTGIFIWGFKGGSNKWQPPRDCAAYRQLQQQGCFFLHPQCSGRKDAADFAICLHAGRMDAQLPKHIPLSVLSGDKGFMEVKEQFARTGRPSHILDPHNTDAKLLCALINSISDSDNADEDLYSYVQAKDPGPLLCPGLSSLLDAEEEAELREALARSLKDMGSTQSPLAS
ncbi:E3 SUMO-protein ligase ZNF451 isoform X1 [Lethenteron reissneri]|uniref:E3 SUMO-protein ligase ZNF451 isoform X1 n=1 Tax=Lethenteron reissneri TaxID=7753 RepID=UPI002AB62260|nr:E3 SUMO-protein ligase ZNF451 isoform X1 [Lethenteron reissneri]XP_061410359.1 E3 SUMO-protein ligase ZNF451 isoform X1 [Lethenteron reissneri]XP_061410360.1 E3 SUMO-protein ligase ZNF451 isoform X1 [Lethenteron reissneri]XP_061410361.1 E3 SUMO-protein ligase ZNF451 isoform X1 [Lethenteron reissneri]XP_061410362.1 E3 SUMO-protein ligase ZNF451 isoform X1 [Lethenteron reissneri]XP_061410363.1 E3 SUMO-protein ligase ZNF451 isoform X1 [Lethenteron reissneri]